MRRLTAITLLVIGVTCGCGQARKEDSALNEQQRGWATNELRNAYAAFNRRDIDAAVQLLDPDVEWTESAEFPGGGTYHGIEGEKRYLTQ